MTQIESAPRDAGTWGTWQSILLGLVLVLAGLVVLRNATAATVASTFIFGVVLLATGMLEVAEAFLSTHWGGFLWRMLIGVLYAIGGGILIADPLAASVMMTLVFAAVLIASGAMRVLLALSHWGRLGWLLLASGAVGILAGLVILFKWPLSGLWVFGLVVGIDLLLHGVWWMVSGWQDREKLRPSPR